MPKLIEIKFEQNKSNDFIKPTWKNKLINIFVCGSRLAIEDERIEHKAEEIFVPIC